MTVIKRPSNLFRFEILGRLKDESARCWRDGAHYPAAKIDRIADQTYWSYVRFNNPTRESE